MPRALIAPCDSAETEGAPRGANVAVLGTEMKLDVRAEVDRLAENPHVSDYDFWRTLKNLENEIFAFESRREPIPFELVRWRSIVRQARMRRGVRA